VVFAILVDWAFVIVGLGAAIAAIRTLGAIKAQGEHTKNSERAWLMVDLEWAPGFSSPQDTANESFEPFTSVPFRLRCSNDGGTPCWIIEKRGCAQIVDSVPAKPDLQKMHTMQFSPEPIKSGKESIPTDGAMECRGHLNDSQTLIIYGVVRYRDVFSEDRETFWGYYWKLGHGPGLPRLAEPDYTKRS